MMDPRLTESLVQLALSCLALATMFVTVYLTPKVKDWLAAEQAKAEAAGHGAQIEVLRNLADTAVRSAEQWLKGSDGAAKKDAAVTWIYWQAHDRGFDITEKQAAALVEEAVLLLKATGLDIETVTAKRERARDPKTGRFLPAKEL